MSAAADRTTVSHGPLWTASAVARRLGVAPATLRSWSARYGIGPAGHEAGRYRRYSPEDVAHLTAVQHLRAQGLPMAAAVETARRPATTPSKAAPIGQAEIEQVVGAADRLDSDTVVHAVRSSIRARGVVATWDQLCRPALTETGRRTATPHDGTTPASEDPGACVAAECVLTWAITTSLRRERPTAPEIHDPQQAVLLACADHEHHTLAVEALAAALEDDGIAVRNLGPSVPFSALEHTVRRTRPAALFVWAQTPRTARSRQLADLGDHTGRVVAAGPGWASRTLPHPVEPAMSIDTAVALARQAVRDRSGRVDGSPRLDG